MKFLSVLIFLLSLSGCVVVPEPSPVYVRPTAVVVTPPVYVAPPVATAVIVTRPVPRRVIIARY